MDHTMHTAPNAVGTYSSKYCMNISVPRSSHPGTARVQHPRPPGSQGLSSSAAAADADRKSCHASREAPGKEARQPLRALRRQSNLQTKYSSSISSSVVGTVDRTSDTFLWANCDPRWPKGGIVRVLV